MTVADRLPGAPQSDALQDAHRVSDHARLTDHHTRAVIDQDPFPQPRRRMNVHREHGGDSTLHRQRHESLPAVPQRVLNAMRLQRVKPLEQQQRVRVPHARRISFLERRDVRPHRLAQLRARRRLLLLRQHRVKNLHQLRRQQRAVRQLIRQHEAQALLQRVVTEYARVQVARQHRLPRRVSPRLLSNRRPNVIHRLVRPLVARRARAALPRRRPDLRRVPPSRDVVRALDLVAKRVVERVRLQVLRVRARPYRVHRRRRRRRRRARRSRRARGSDGDGASDGERGEKAREKSGGGAGRARGVGGVGGEDGRRARDEGGGRRRGERDGEIDGDDDGDDGRDDDAGEARDRF
mmetsp:Transcript_4989/g.19194  ORF Transcript_4989/g.19194 Transcript_4989/m.19194 type:complete len:351 (-) Transcript_4989:778-1830(-)